MNRSQIKSLLKQIKEEVKKEEVTDMRIFVHECIEQCENDDELQREEKDKHYSLVNGEVVVQPVWRPNIGDKVIDDEYI